MSLDLRTNLPLLTSPIPPPALCGISPPCLGVSVPIQPWSKVPRQRLLPQCTLGNGAVLMVTGPWGHCAAEPHGYYLERPAAVQHSKNPCPTVTAQKLRDGCSLICKSFLSETQQLSCRTRQSVGTHRCCHAGGGVCAGTGPANPPQTTSCLILGFLSCFSLFPFLF